jgi:carboxypeptidase family protein
VRNFWRTLCLLTLVLVVAANGQSTNGNIQGTIVDPQGATVAGATVTGRNMDTGLTASATTSGAGVYALSNLPPGRYAVTVEASGMKKYKQEGITVTTNSTVGLDVTLQVGSANESVNVIADAAQLET